MRDADRNFTPELGREIHRRPEAAIAFFIGRRDHADQRVDLPPREMTPDFIVAKGIVRHPATKIGSQFRGHKECFDAALSVRKIAMAVDARHDDAREGLRAERVRSEEHTSDLQSLMRTPYAVFCLKKKRSL